MNKSVLKQLLDGMSAQSQNERSNSQMTLGELISALKQHDKEMAVSGISCKPMSYRGYYCDLSFEPGHTTVEELQAAALDAIGQTFEGYKGGDFEMGKSTPIWVAAYGSTGERVMSVVNQGLYLEVFTEPEDDQA